VTNEILSITPETMDAIPAEHRPVVLAHLLALQARIIARMGIEPPAASNGQGDQLLTIEQTMVRLSVTKDWLRRRPDLPFVRHLSEGVVRYSAKGIEAWQKTRA